MRLGAMIIVALLVIVASVAISRAFTSDADSRLTGNIEDTIQRHFDEIVQDAPSVGQVEAPPTSTSTAQ